MRDRAAILARMLDGLFELVVRLEGRVQLAGLVPERNLNDLDFASRLAALLNTEVLS